MTDKTYKIYNVEAKGTIKLWMDVEASSQEEAEALACLLYTSDAADE